MFRIANDLRFAAGRTPYKTYLYFVFWEGDRGPCSDPVDRAPYPHPSAPAPAYPLRPDEISTITGPCCTISSARRPLHRHRPTAAMAALNEPTRVRMPAGIDLARARARYAIRDSLNLTCHRLPKQATTPAFPNWVRRPARLFTDMHQRLAATLSGNSEHAASKPPGRPGPNWMSLAGVRDALRGRRYGDSCGAGPDRCGVRRSAMILLPWTPTLSPGREKRLLAQARLARFARCMADDGIEAGTRYACAGIARRPR